MNNPQEHSKHLYYIGSNITDNAKITYSDSLLFDKSRNSIFAQNHEFGYICDYENSIDLRNADGTNTTTITLKVENGQITLKEYRSVLITSYTARYSVIGRQTTDTPYYSGTTYVLGSSVITEGISFTTSGSEVCNNINIKQYSTGDTLYQSDSHSIIENNQYNIDLTCDKNLRTVNGNSTGNKQTVILTITDPKSNIASKTSVISFYNNIMVMQFEKDGKDFYELEEDITKDNGNLNSIISNYSTHTFYNKLTDSYKLGGTSINCTNGPDKYISICCPKRVCNVSSFTGILGGAAVQEFKKIKEVSYINSASYEEMYNIYLATGHNWAGQSLVIK